MKNAMLLFLFLTALSCLADTVVLHNGSVLRGRIVRETAVEIVIEVPFGKLTIERAKVARIEKEDSRETILYNAENLMRRGTFDRAISYLKGEQEKSDAPWLRKVLADAHMRAGQYFLDKGELDQAREHFLKAPLYEPGIDASFFLGEIQTMRGMAGKQIEQADRLLKQGKGRSAAEAYLGVLENFPGSEKEIAERFACACAMAGSEYHRERDFSSAVFYYDLALEYRPEIFSAIERAWLEAHLSQIAESELQGEKWREARISLFGLLEVSPSCRPVLYLLGLTYEQEREYGRAFAHYQAVLQQRKAWSGRMDEFAKVRLLAKEEARIPFLEGEFLEGFSENPGEGPWSELSTPHFQIFHCDEAIAERVGHTLEYHFGQIAERFAPEGGPGEWPMPCLVYLHGSKSSYLRSTKTAAWSEGCNEMRFRSGKLHKHAVHLYQSAPLLTSSILPHELTHVMYPWFLGYQGQLPLWLSEGLAMCSEPPFRQKNRLRLARAALRGGNLPELAAMCALRSYPEEEGSVDLFYSQAFSLVSLLLERCGKQKIFEFARAASMPSSAASAWRIFGFQGPESIEIPWQNSLRGEEPPGDRR